MRDEIIRRLETLVTKLEAEGRLFDRDTASLALKELRKNDPTRI